MGTKLKSFQQTEKPKVQNNDSLDTALPPGYTEQYKAKSRFSFFF